MNKQIIDGVHSHIHNIGNLADANIIEFKEGYSKLSYNVTEDNLNIHSTLHGGMIFTLCDVASAISTYCYGINNVTQSSNIQYLKPIPVGLIYIESKIINKGRKIATNNVQITDSNGKLYANATFCMFLLDELK